MKSKSLTGERGMEGEEMNRYFTFCQKKEVSKAFGTFLSHYSSMCKYIKESLKTKLALLVDKFFPFMQNFMIERDRKWTLGALTRVLETSLGHGP